MAVGMVRTLVNDGASGVPMELDHKITRLRLKKDYKLIQIKIRDPRTKKERPHAEWWEHCRNTGNRIHTKGKYMFPRRESQLGNSKETI